MPLEDDNCRGKEGTDMLEELLQVILCLLFFNSHNSVPVVLFKRYLVHVTEADKRIAHVKSSVLEQYKLLNAPL